MRDSVLRTGVETKPNLPPLERTETETLALVAQSSTNTCVDRSCFAELLRRGIKLGEILDSNVLKSIETDALIGDRDKAHACLDVVEAILKIDQKLQSAGRDDLAEHSVKYCIKHFADDCSPQQLVEERLALSLHGKLVGDQKLHPVKSEISEVAIKSSKYTIIALYDSDRLERSQDGCLKPRTGETLQSAFLADIVVLDGGAFAMDAELAALSPSVKVVNSAIKVALEAVAYRLHVAESKLKDLSDKDVALNSVKAEIRLYQRIHAHLSSGELPQSLIARTGKLVEVYEETVTPVGGPLMNRAWGPGTVQSSEVHPGIPLDVTGVVWPGLEVKSRGVHGILEARKWLVSALEEKISEGCSPFKILADLHATASAYKKALRIEIAPLYEIPSATIKTSELVDISDCLSRVAQFGCGKAAFDDSLNSDQDELELGLPVISVDGRVRPCDINDRTEKLLAESVVLVAGEEAIHLEQFALRRTLSSLGPRGENESSYFDPTHISFDDISQCLTSELSRQFFKENPKQLTTLSKTTLAERGTMIAEVDVLARMMELVIQKRIPQGLILERLYDYHSDDRGQFVEWLTSKGLIEPLNLSDRG